MHLSSRAPAAGRDALLATILAACGGAAPTAPPTQPPPTDGEPTATAEPTAVVTTAALETTVWYAGFKLTFDTATAILVPDRGGTLAIDATFENLGTSTSTLDATIVVSSAGSAYEPSFETDLPNVPGTASGNGTIVFEVDERPPRTCSPASTSTRRSRATYAFLARDDGAEGELPFTVTP